jgi:hypothetical protein
VTKNGQRGPRAFWGRDRYAAFARGTLEDTEGGFGGTDVFVASRGLADTVIPGIRNHSLKLTGEHPEHVDAIAAAIFARGRDSLWREPTLPMELHGWIRQLIVDGELILHVDFDRPAPGEPYRLKRVTWLGPETIRHRGRVYEQFVSRRAFEGSGVIVAGRPEDRLVEIAAAEIVRIGWPFPTRGRSPVQDTRKLRRQIDREMRRGLLAARAGAELNDPYLTLARGRAGAYRRALERQKLYSARIKDLLYYPGTEEALTFHWVEETTSYFMAERMLRSRIAICRLRAHLLDQISTQLFGRWTELNGWGCVRLDLATDTWAEKDWREMRAELDRGTVTLEDVEAAVVAEGQNARRR